MLRDADVRSLGVPYCHSAAIQPVRWVPVPFMARPFAGLGQAHDFRVVANAFPAHNRVVSGGCTTHDRPASELLQRKAIDPIMRCKIHQRQYKFLCVLIRYIDGLTAIELPGSRTHRVCRRAADGNSRMPTAGASGAPVAAAIRMGFANRGCRKMHALTHLTRQAISIRPTGARRCRPEPPTSDADCRIRDLPLARYRSCRTGRAPRTD